MSAVIDERALVSIALMDSAHDICRNVPRIRAFARPARTRLVGRGILALLELATGQLERAVKDLDDVSGGDLMAQQCLHDTQIVVHLLAHRELERETLRP